MYIVHIIISKTNREYASKIHKFIHKNTYRKVVLSYSNV